MVFSVLNSLVFVINKSLSISNDIIETMTLGIVHTLSHILITRIYRLHTTNVEFFNPELDTLLNVIKSNRNIYMVVGDFNIDLLKVHYHPPTSAFYI